MAPCALSVASPAYSASSASASLRQSSASPPRRRASAPTRSSGRVAERRVVDQLDREAALADEQLRRRRSRPSATASGTTTASVRPAARWQYVIACAPMTRTRSVSGASAAQAARARAPRASPRSRGTRSSSFGPSVSGSPFRNAPLAAHGRPLLVRAEVVDVAEEDVVDRVAVGDRDREREVRDAALGVLRAVDRVDEHRVAALAPDADLLGDDADVVAVEVLQRRRSRPPRRARP